MRSAEIRKEARKQLAELRKGRLEKRRHSFSKSDRPRELEETATYTLEVEEAVDRIELSENSSVEEKVSPNTAVHDSVDITTSEGKTSDVAPSDLSLLPGAGPGLVWILNESGIFKMSDLANADPKALATTLGQVGEILDMEYWVDFAKQKSGL